MPGQTPVYALPYPTGSDDIRQGDDTIKALAQRIEAILSAPTARNVIRNGDMSIAQRGRAPGGTTGDRFTVDGWKAYAVGGSHTFASFATGPGTATGVDGAAWHLASTVAGQSAAGDSAVFYQRIEDVRTLAGKQVTLSALLEGAAGLKVAVEVAQSFGTGGSPSATVYTPVGVITLVAGPVRRYSLTFVMPSIAGKTIGSSGTDHVQLTLWVSGGTSQSGAQGIGIQNAAMNITDVQLESGPNATLFERLPQQQQLAWCQRYYYRFTATAINQTVGWGGAPSAVTAYVEWKFPVTMRAAPAIAVSSPGGWRLSDRLAEWTCTVINTAGANYATVASVDLQCTTSGGMTARAATLLYSVAAGSWIEASAEL